MEGYPMDTLWETMWSTLGGTLGSTLGGTLWSTLGGTLWRPRNPRGYPQNPWILERDSRETVSRERQLPKHGSQKSETSEKSEKRTDTTHSGSSSNPKGEWSERGRPFSPTHECEQGEPYWEPHWEPFDVEGHRREGWDIQTHVI